jgi:hypothetical protein
MATARAMLERRRSSRVSTRIPVKVFNNESEGQSHDTEAFAVSRYGALIRVPFSPTMGSRIEVVNERSQEMRQFRVIRVEAKANGLYELGLEILYPSRNFWGIQFPGERRSS